MARPAHVKGEWSYLSATTLVAGGCGAQTQGQSYCPLKMDLGNDDDDLFASLGGSLMKNLLADLNDESGTGGLLSLEELEQELAHFEDRAAPVSVAASPAMNTTTANTAASMVVRAQEQIQNASANQNDSFPNTMGTPPLDAWSLSLEKFTAASLQEDFLLADSERKAKSSGKPAAKMEDNSALFSTAEEYDVSEPMLVSPPPGLAARSSDSAAESLVQQLTTKLETVAVVDSSSKPSSEEIASRPPVPHRHNLPRTPQNSLNLNLPKPPPPTPQNSVSVNLGVSPTNSSSEALENIPIVREEALQNRHVLGEPPSSIPPLSHVTGSPEPKVANLVKPIVPQVSSPPPAAPNAWNRPPAHPMSSPMASPPPPPQPVSAPQPRTILYCNPRPDAKTIPATAIAANFMSARDISYVVHSILKPILNHQLQNPVSPFDYDRAFLQKTMGVQPLAPTVAGRNQSKASPGGQQGKSLQEEMESRAAKAKNWSVENSVLGRTTKSQVTRPRALIAQPTKEELEEANNNSEQRQRQALWKARIYCDQAYQAYMNVVQTWHEVAASPNSAMTPSAAATLQPHLFKLLRCLGLSRSDNSQDVELTKESQQQLSYVVANESALPLLTKLPKGRILLARVLDQALLPPAAVAVLLPSLFKTMYLLPMPNIPASTTPTDQNMADIYSAAAAQEQANDRVFAAATRVLQTLPEIPQTEILKALDIVQEHSIVALQSPVRMQAVHALLQRGTQLAASDAEFAQTWKGREEAFLQVLSG